MKEPMPERFIGEDAQSKISLQSTPSKRRNELIADMFNKIRLVEKRGRRI